MSKKKSKLQQAQDEAQAAINETNKKIEELGKHSNNLCIELNNIQKLFDEIRNIPSEKKIECEKLKKIRLNWKQQAEKIESDYKAAAVKNAGAGAAGVSAGVAVAAMGPTAAMGIATTFGVASTGTAISTLSGAAATNAALAWLGGGALAAGGGGMAAGEAFLTLAGPVGWAIAGVALVASGIMFWRSSSKKKRIEEIFTLISKRDYEKYKVRRYGFHGTSHSFVSKACAEYLKLDLKNSKIIVAHLGNGASVSAVLNGECVDTSMGLTPLEGLVMGTRSGVPLYVLLSL